MFVENCCGCKSSEEAEVKGLEKILRRGSLGGRLSLIGYFGLAWITWTGRHYTTTTTAWITGCVARKEPRATRLWLILQCCSHRIAAQQRYSQHGTARGHAGVRGVSFSISLSLSLSLLLTLQVQPPAAAAAAALTCLVLASNGLPPTRQSRTATKCTFSNT